MSELGPYNFSDDKLLVAEELYRRLKYQRVATIVCHLVWGIIHLVFDLKTAGTVHPHILAAAIGGVCHYAAEIFKVDRYLRALREEISFRSGLHLHNLMPRDYIEVVFTGISLSLGACGAIEVVGLVWGIRNAVAK